jgi:hypothetical protein
MEPRVDSAQLYSSTLDRLNKIREKMLSAEWDAKLQRASQTERLRAVELLLDVQHARLVLSNAILQDIAEDLKKNEADLRAGQNDVQAKLDKLDAVASVLDTIGKFIGIVGRIVSLF